MSKDHSHTTIETQLTVLGRNPQEQEGFVNPSIYRGSTVIYPNYQAIKNRTVRFGYGTEGTPTTDNLAQAWTALTGAAGTVIAPSGLGALTLALLAVTKQGDHILVTDSVYRPTRIFCNDVLKKYGVTIEYYDPLIGEGIASLLKPNTSLIVLEAPGSQTFEVQDVGAIAKVAQAHNVATLIDNTWATPLFFKPHDYGIDITVEAATKYVGGHSDILMGLVTANQKYWPAIYDMYDMLSMTPSGEDCFLALRGLRTLHIRLQEAQQRGLAMAHWLKEQPEVVRVLHPAFPECPGHENFKKYFKGASGLFSVELDPRFTEDDVARLLDHLELFSMGFSWGGYESLVIPFDCTTYRTATTPPFKGRTLRFQIGFENLADLQADLLQGFKRLYAK